MSSCIGIKNFKTEDLNVQNTLRDSSVVVKDSMTNFMWRDIFVDTTLQNIIQEGIENNSDLLVATENIYQSQQYIRSSKWAYAPTLAGVFQSQYNNSPELENVYIGGRLSWEPDVWGKITASKRAKVNKWLADISSVRAVQSELVANIAMMYYQLLAYDEQMEVVKEFVKISEETLRTITVMRDNGASNSAAVEQTKAQLYSAQASIPMLEKTIYSTENSLSLLIGRNAGDIPRYKSETIMNLDFIQKGFPFGLVSNRPDVKLAEYTLIQLFNIKESSKAAMYPAITIGFDIGVGSSSSMYNFLDPGNLIMNFVGGLTAPIFNGRALKTQYKVNTSRQKQAVEQFEQTLRAAGSEVSEAIFANGRNKIEVELKMKEVESNKKAVDYTSTLLFNGSVTYIEVLSAQGNMLTSSKSLIESRLQQEINCIKLYKALGGGWR